MAVSKLTVEGYFRKVFLGTLAITAAGAGIFLFFGLRSWSRGVALGGAASLFNLLIMAGQIRRRAPGYGGKGLLSAGVLYGLRLAVFSSALIYAVSNDSIALWGTIPFLFASQVVLVAGEVVDKRE